MREKQPVPASPPAGEKRDLVAEQVNRIGEPTPAAIVSDAPNSLHQRTVRIYQPSKPATQSGKAGTRDWRLDFDILQGSGRWESPLMGWASTADHQQALVMKFDTREDAIHFCRSRAGTTLCRSHTKHESLLRATLPISSTRPASCAFTTPSKQFAADMRVRTGELYVGDV